MKYVLKLEELAIFACCTALLYFHEVPWWAYLLLALGPDVGMIGYLINSKIGAYTYNLFHHKAVAFGFIAAGLFMPNESVMVTGIILLGHSSMDRVFGFGLKHTDDFKNTHLGRIG